MWAVTIEDVTQSWGFNQTFAYITPGASAEWIEEAPTVDSSQSTLANFGTMTFTSIGVDGIRRVDPLPRRHARPDRDLHHRLPGHLHLGILLGLLRDTPSDGHLGLAESGLHHRWYERDHFRQLPGRCDRGRLRLDAGRELHGERQHPDPHCRVAGREQGNGGRHRHHARWDQRALRLRSVHLQPAPADHQHHLVAAGDGGLRLLGHARRNERHARLQLVDHLAFAPGLAEPRSRDRRAHRHADRPRGPSR